MMKFKLKTRNVALTTLVAVMLALVFWAYLQPSFIVDLANRYVFC